MFRELSVGKRIHPSTQAIDVPLADETPQVLRVQPSRGKIANTCDAELSHEIEYLLFFRRDIHHV